MISYNNSFITINGITDYKINTTSPTTFTRVYNSPQLLNLNSKIFKKDNNVFMTFGSVTTTKPAFGNNFTSNGDYICGITQSGITYTIDTKRLLAYYQPPYNKLETSYSLPLTPNGDFVIDDNGDIYTDKYMEKLNVEFTWGIIGEVK